MGSSSHETADTGLLYQYGPATERRGELRDRPHCVAHERRELLGLTAGGKPEDPVGEVRIRRFYAVAVELEERQHRDERQALVGVDERLALGDAVRKHSGLQRDIGVLVIGVAARPAEGALESAWSRS